MVRVAVELGEQVRAETVNLDIAYKSNRKLKNELGGRDILKHIKEAELQESN
jgi:hypothetical protein